MGSQCKTIQADLRERDQAAALAAVDSGIGELKRRPAPCKRIAGGPTVAPRFRVVRGRAHRAVLIGGPALPKQTGPLVLSCAEEDRVSAGAGICSVSSAGVERMLILGVGFVWWHFPYPKVGLALKEPTGFVSSLMWLWLRDRPKLKSVPQQRDIASLRRKKSKKTTIH